MQHISAYRHRAVTPDTTTKQPPWRCRFLMDAAMVKKSEKKPEYKDTVTSPFLNKPHVNKIED